ncbi:MAG: lysine--tRNA ligase, partial [Candidatus Hydrogenedentes bacterium]|nr:lysine--tRNA ligase [Candidatus Hydrogenedentota bacterium]
MSTDVTQNQDGNETEVRGGEAELRRHRIAKLERIRERNDDPYKYVFERSHIIRVARQEFEDIEKVATEEAPAALPAQLAGRLVARRVQGKSTFMDIRDEQGRIQIFLGLKQVGEESYEASKDLDIGDYIGVSGTVKRTRRGEITIFAERYELLSKSLRPAAEKFHGLSNVETRYRHRYLDMVANPEVLEVFRKRILMVQIMREWLISRGYLEVETPMLHPIPGGATARPF